MTTPPAVFAQFGPTLAFAERTLTAVLREHLAQRDCTPETWYVFQLVSSKGPEFPVRRSPATLRVHGTSTAYPRQSCSPGSKPRGWSAAVLTWS